MSGISTPYEYLFATLYFLKFGSKSSVSLNFALSLAIKLGKDRNFSIRLYCIHLKQFRLHIFEFYNLGHLHFESSIQCL